MVDDVVAKLALPARFEIQRAVGEGGMGSVYLAWDRELKRRVAVKVLKRACCGVPAMRRRFVREAQSLARLAHPGVVKIFDVHPDGEAPYFVQEYVEGETLEDIVRAESLIDVHRARAIARSLAEALAALHEHQIVHRDIKPANVIIDGAGRPRLVDFGLALDCQRTRMTLNTPVLGTLHYVSPEVLRGEPATPASDVYQFGLLFWRILIGTLPDVDSIDQLLDTTARRDHSRETPAPPGDLPEDLRGLIVACTRKSPAERPRDGTFLLAFLDGTRSERPEPTGGPEAHRATRPWLVFSLVSLLAVLCALFLSRAPVPPPSVPHEIVTFPDWIHLSCTAPEGERLTWHLAGETSRKTGYLTGKGNRWSAEVRKLAPHSRWLLTVYRGRRILLQRHVSLPQTTFASPVRGRVGVDWFSLSWKLHGPSPLDVWVGSEREALASQGRYRGACTIENLPVGPTARVRYELRLGSRVVAQGTVRLGLRHMFKTAPSMARFGESYWLGTHRGPGRRFAVLYESGHIVSLAATGTATGSVLTPVQSFDVGLYTLPHESRGDRRHGCLVPIDTARFAVVLGGGFSRIATLGYTPAGRFEPLGVTAVAEVMHHPRALPLGTGDCLLLGNEPDKVHLRAVLVEEGAHRLLQVREPTACGRVDAVAGGTTGLYVATSVRDDEGRYSFAVHGFRLEGETTLRRLFSLPLEGVSSPTSRRDLGSVALAAGASRCVAVAGGLVHVLPPEGPRSDTSYTLRCDGSKGARASLLMRDGRQVLALVAGKGPTAGEGELLSRLTVRLLAIRLQGDHPPDIAPCNRAVALPGLSDIFCCVSNLVLHDDRAYGAVNNWLLVFDLRSPARPPAIVAAPATIERLIAVGPTLYAIGRDDTISAIDFP